MTEIPDEVIEAEDSQMLVKIMDTLAYYHCRAVNPKADSPITGYHAMEKDQREFLQSRQREAAQEIDRMISEIAERAREQALSEAEAIVTAGFFEDEQLPDDVEQTATAIAALRSKGGR